MDGGCTQKDLRLCSLREGRILTKHNGRFDEILLLEDNSTAAVRRRFAGVGSEADGKTITVQVHRMNGAHKIAVAHRTYVAGSMRSQRSARIELAARLIDRAANGTSPVVVAGTSYGATSAFLEMLGERDFPFVVQIRPSTVVQLMERGSPTLTAAEVLKRGRWRNISTVMPDGATLACSAAKLATVALPTGVGQLFAAQVGGIQGVHRGTIIGLASFDASVGDLVQTISHVRWIRRDNSEPPRSGSSRCR